MKWIEAKVIFDSEDNEFAVDLVAGIFYSVGLKGVIIETPDDGSIDNWAEGARPNTSHYAVAGYFIKDDTLDENCQLLENELLRLKQAHNISSTIAYREIDEEDWAESWKAYFWPEKISDKIVVKPTWREYTFQKDDIVIEIDPGMAFGTGTHPTTSLCVNMIEKYIKPGDSVLDVGTGSGILMVAAAKLGAGIVHGIDNDSLAVEIAERNLKLNSIDTSRFKVTKGDLIDTVQQKYNLVVSNILADVIIDLLDNIKDVLVENGVFICSGFTVESKDTLERKIIEQGFKIVEYEIKEDWVAVVGKLVST
jgi:ribosomal protein L11 methyltransferase